jgi:Na+/phosphate symporter
MFGEYEEGFTIKLAAIPEAMYRFLKGMDMMNDGMQEMFGEPVQIHSNINNGIGIFAISSTTIEHVVAN